MIRSVPRAAAGILMAAAVASGCAGNNRVDRPGQSAPSASLSVLAASSLTETFGELGRRFADAHPGVDVSSSFDSSPTLVHQLQAGAPADVVATADETTMQAVANAGLVGTPHVFARNRLALLVRQGNPKRVSSLADLARPSLVVVLCAPEVPCGRLAAGVLERAGVAVQPRSLELNVKAVVNKVVLGEADAGIVYATDVKAAGGRAEGIPLPSEQNATASYAIAVVRRRSNRAEATAFVDYVRSEQGRVVLAAAGFEP